MTALDINSPLLHLAMLETLKRDDIRDEIDLFLPFIAVTVSEIGKATITDIDVQERLLQSFGFKPPLSAIQVLMSRAKKRGMLKRENYAFIPIHEKVVEWKNGYEDKKLDLEVSLSSLKNEFINFTKDKFGKNISSEDSESLILSFIEENVSSVITERAYDKSLLNKEIKNTDHIIASFIGHIHRNMPTTLEHFSRCVKGMLLANYLFYADKAISKNSYSDIVVYLDSPIIVGLLGYNGVQKKQVLDEFLGLLKTLEIKTKIFDKSLSEIEGLLYAWKADLANNNYSRFNTKTLELLKSQGYDSERLDTELKLLTSRIEGLGIEIQLGFNSKEKYQCDESALEKAISVNFKKSKDLTHDLICLSRVHNQREGKIIRNLSQKFTVFVTPNTGLVKTANNFFNDEIGKDSIPIVVSEQWMTAMFWLKKPDIYNSLPIEQLLSSAYSLLYKDDKFWSSFLIRFDNLQKRGLITEDDFVQVRWDTDLLRLVHDVSVDVGEDFSEDDVFDVVQKIKAKNEDLLQSKIEIVKLEAEDKIKTITDESVGTKIQLNKLEAKIKKISCVISKVIAWVISGFLCFALIIVALKAIPDAYQPSFISHKIFQGYMYAIIVMVTIALGLISSFFGFDLSFYHKKIQGKIERKLTAFFYN